MNHKLKILTPTQIELAKRLKSKGATWGTVAKQFDCSPHTIKRAIDPDWRDKTNARRRRKIAKQKPVESVDNGKTDIHEFNYTMHTLPGGTEICIKFNNTKESVESLLATLTIKQNADKIFTKMSD